MLCGRTTTVEHRASGPVIAGAAASVAGFFSRERWARNAVLRRPGISSMHIARAPAMRSDGLLGRVGNIIRGKTTAASSKTSLQSAVTAVKFPGGETAGLCNSGPGPGLETRFGKG